MEDTIPVIKISDPVHAYYGMKTVWDSFLAKIFILGQSGHCENSQDGMIFFNCMIFFHVVLNVSPRS